MKEQDPNLESPLVAGEKFAQIVREQLGACISYTKENDSLIPLGNNLSALSQIDPSPEIFATEFAQLGTSIINNARSKALNSHVRMLKNVGKIQLIDPQNPEEKKWEFIPPKDRKLFADNLEAQSKSEENFPALDDDTSEMLNYAIELTGDELGQLIKDFHESLPMHSHDKSRAHKIGARVARIVTRNAKSVYAIDITPREAQVLSRKATKLNKFITELLKSPEAVLAKMGIAQREEAILDDFYQKIDERILRSNTELFASLSPAQKPKYKPEPKQEIEEPVRKVSVQPELKFSKEIDLEPKIADKGEPLLALPWIYDSRPTPVPLTEISIGDQTVYIARGISDSLLKIAEVCRKKAPVRSDDQNEYDYVAQLHARRIAEGIMPYQQSSSSVRRLKTTAKNLNDAYKDLAIWYSFTSTNNSITSRLYYTLKKMSEIMAEDLPGVKADSFCLIVLAETDKEYQPEVLKTFGA